MLRDAIQAGRYPVGARLPTEERLCGMFDASRQTLREALRTLTEEGLILRRPRAGSVVIARQSPTAFVQTVASIENMLNYPSGTQRKTIETGYVEADHALASLLKCAPGTSWFLIRALRYPQGSKTPICGTDIYILPRFAGVTRHRQHESIAVADQIAEMYGATATRTQIEVFASEVSPPLAKRLSVVSGSPGLTIIRRYAGADGQVFETTISVHAGQRFTYAFELRREKTAHAARRSAGS